MIRLEVFKQHLKQGRNVLALLIVAGISFGAGAIVFRRDGEGTDHSHAASVDDSGGGQEQTGTVWTCSMHPQIRQPDPGPCPICAMDLIPLDDASGKTDTPPNQVVLSERAKTLARIRTEVVQRDENPAVDIRLLGRIDPKESTLRTVTSWLSGRIDRLHVNTTGQRIRKGQVIATLYSPEIYTAHQDLLVAKRQLARVSKGTESARRSSDAALESIRERLGLLGVSKSDIERMESASSPWRQVPIRSPFSGTVLERMATQGAYVTTGAPLYRVVDLSKVWVQLDAYENDLKRIAVKQPVTLYVEAFPGEVFEGRVSFIDPTLDPNRRTARVRVEVANPRQKLRPGMFVQAVLQGGTTSHAVEPERPLLIPKSAPIFTGRRSLVFVEVPEAERPTYEARIVRLGPRSGDKYPVVAGLRSGERVVVHGAFVLDADLQIRGGASMMAAPDDDQHGAWDQLIEMNSRQRSVFRPVVSAYLEVQAGLAGDDLAAARKGAKRLISATKGVKIKKHHRARGAFARIATAALKHAKKIKVAGSIEVARQEFEGLSEQVETMLGVFGNPLAEPLRQAYCPMAFDNRGATWIQREDVISNSYFGASMLRCGEFKATIEPGNYLARAVVEPTAEEHLH